MLTVERKGEIHLLEFSALAVIFPLCRFTNSIARNANTIPKSSSARRIGRGRNARIAARPKSRRNFPRSPHPARAKRHPARKAAWAAATVAVAAATRIELFS
jgi:hypothetical protein